MSETVAPAAEREDADESGLSQQLRLMRFVTGPRGWLHPIEAG